jgi:glycosyltransferase involved in cell wall biosynthesis
LKIGIDARLALLQPHGMGRYILHLIHELAQIDGENSYILYTDRPDDGRVLPARMQTRILKSGNYAIFEQFLLPAAAKKDGIQILHCPANTAPLRLDSRINLVMTIHDVMYLHREDTSLDPGNWYQRLGRAYRRAVVPRAVRRARLIMTDSAFSREDMKEFFQADGAPVEIVHLGCEFLGSTDPQTFNRLEHRYSLGDAYILMFGGIAPRKNTKLGMKVFSLLGNDPALRLVVASIPLKARAEFLRCAQELEIASNVVFLDFLAEEELREVLGHARLLLFISKFEGFGIPVLEAMLCGVPVVASNVTSIPEISGDAALLVNPDNVTEIAAAARSILADPNLRKTLISKGLDRAALFTWRKTAVRVMECYQVAARY